MTVPDWSDRWEAGALATKRAEGCQVPDPDRVVRVTFDEVPTFHYDDGRPTYELPALTEEPTP